MASCKGDTEYCQDVFALWEKLAVVTDLDEAIEIESQLATLGQRCSEIMALVSFCDCPMQTAQPTPSQ